MAEPAALVILQAVTYGELIMVPVQEPDGTWIVLNRDSVDYFDSATEVRRFADQMVKDGVYPEEAEAYRMLADIMDSSGEDADGV